MTAAVKAQNAVSVEVSRKKLADFRYFLQTFSLHCLMKEWRLSKYCIPLMQSRAYPTILLRLHSRPPFRMVALPGENTRQLPSALWQEPQCVIPCGMDAMRQ